MTNFNHTQNSKVKKKEKKRRKEQATSQRRNSREENQCCTTRQLQEGDIQCSPRGGGLGNFMLSSTEKKKERK